MVKSNQCISVSKQVALTFLIVTVFFLSSLSAAAKEVVVIPLIKNNISAISPSDVVRLGTTSVAPGVTSNFIGITPQAANVGPFTVPAGKYLVITSISVFPESPGTGNIEMQLIQNSYVTAYWKLPNTEPSSLSFGPGMLIDEGFALSVGNYAASPGSIRVSIYGYLTNK